MVLKDVRPIISELVSIKNSIPLTEDVGRYLPDVRVNVHGEGVRCGIKKALRLIEQAPTIEVESVRHGRWVYGDDVDIQCSECGRDAMSDWMKYTQVHSPYCPWCGAKMDGSGER